MSSNFFSERQLLIIKSPTPKEHIEEKTDKGQKVKYVSGTYVKQVLNELFGYNWTETIIKTDFFPHPQACVIVHVRLTGYTDNGEIVVKEQFGGAYVDGSLPYAYKAAATDGLKKCAAEIGLFSDVYTDEKANETPIEEHPLQTIERLRNECVGLEVSFTKADINFFTKTVNERNEGNYQKCIYRLKKYIEKTKA